MNNPTFNPFPGLRPFESHEAYLFFGRDGQSDELLRRLRRTRFLAVVGTSGSGKSSLMRAGLLPALHGGMMAKAGASWHVAVMRPGADPIGNLAQALQATQLFPAEAALANYQTSILRAGLSRSSLGLIETCKQALLPANENLLVVVDQFEELFRFKQEAHKTGHGDEAAAFVQLLLEAGKQTEVPIYVVLTMRSDFLGDCAQFQNLPEAINDGQYLIPRMTREQRRQAIAGPVAVGGATMTPRLVNRLLNDVGDNPDQLPILQHALMRTWDYWTQHHKNGEPIDLPHYEAIGGMLMALSHHADEAFEELPDARYKMMAEKLFKALTEKGADNREIRRPTLVHEACAITGAEEQEVIAVVDTFRHPGRTFLMPPSEVKLHADSLVDISHESLIRNWQRLKKWVAEEAQSAQIYRRLAETTVLYEEGKAGLWRDPDLHIALEWRERRDPNKAWAQRYHPEFEKVAHFLEASKSSREAEIRAKELQHKRELKRTRIFVAILSVALLMAVGFGFMAIKQRNETQKRTYAAGYTLAKVFEEKASSAFGSGELQQAWLYTLAALNQEVHPDSLLKISYGRLLLPEFSGEVFKELWGSPSTSTKAIAFSPDGRIIASGSSGKINLWEVASGKLVMALSGHFGTVRSVAFSPDGAKLASALDDKTLRLWEVASGKEIAVLSYDRKESMFSMAFSPDGAMLASGSYNKTVHLWEVSSGKELAVLKGHGSSIKAVAFSPDGRLLASGSSDHTVRLWEVASEKEIAVLSGYSDQASNWPFQASNVAFSPDGTLLAWGGNDDNIHLWDIASQKEIALLSGYSGGVAFSRDGTMLASGAIRLWEVSSLKEIAVLPGNSDAVAFSPDGKLLASVSDDHNIHLWEVPTRKPIAAFSYYGYYKCVAISSDGRWIVLTPHHQETRLVEVASGKEITTLPSSLAVFSPDGRLLASGFADSTVRLWEASSGKEIAVLSNHSGAIECLAFSRDGARLALGSADMTIRLWEVASRKEIAVLSGHTNQVTSVAFSPDGTRLASGLADDTIRLWEVSSGREIAVLSEHATVTHVEFSPDGKWLASWSSSGEGHLWHLASRKEIAILPNLLGECNEVTFVTDDERSSTMAEDYRIRINLSHLRYYWNEDKNFATLRQLFEASQFLLPFRLEGLNLVPKERYTALTPANGDTVATPSKFQKLLRPRPPGVDPVDWILANLE